MKLYRAKVPDIAKEAIEVLASNGDIEIEGDRRADAEADLVAIMEDYLRRDSDLREGIKDKMAREGIPYGNYGRIRSRMAEQRGHPLGDDVERYLVRQFVEMLMISPSVAEVFEEDKIIYKKLMSVLKGYDVDEDAIREEARKRIKNVTEGTVEFEIAMRQAVRDVKKSRGLL